MQGMMKALLRVGACCAGAPIFDENRYPIVAVSITTAMNHQYTIHQRGLRNESFDLAP